jgi:hypothetical protein
MSEANAKQMVESIENALKNSGNSNLTAFNLPNKADAIKALMAGSCTALGEGMAKGFTATITANEYNSSVLGTFEEVESEIMEKMINGNLIFNENYIVAAENIVKKFFDPNHNLNAIGEDINAEALQFAVAQRNGLFKNGTIGDIENFIALCVEIWLDHYGASFLSLSCYNSYINKINEAGSNLEKAVQILLRGKEVKKKVDFFALLTDTTDDLIGMIGGQNAIFAKTKPRFGKIKIKSEINDDVNSELKGLLQAENARKLPGIATGNGNVVDASNWLRGTNKNAGLFPSHIANKLRGKKFNTYDEFRAAFWKEVGNDPNLNKNFKPTDLYPMKTLGLAPKCAEEQQLGKQIKYVIHHKNPIQNGGKVYDMDNLIICTPRYHKEVLDPKFHF